MKIFITTLIAFITILSINAQTTTEISQLIANDAAGSSYFGQSVSISGDYAVIGASITDGNVTNSGAAYVFQYISNSWTQVAKLTPSDGAADDYFGISVDISGDYIIIGSQYNEGVESKTGAAYIYEKPGTGWIDMTETQKLTAADGVYYDYYGISVTIDGAYAAVGAENDDVSYPNSGSVYIYNRGAIEWTQQAKINHGDIGGSDYFGCAVSLEGTYLVAGARDNNDWGSGYVFERSGTTWTQVAKLSASDLAAGDALGKSVSISGNWIILGASGSDVAGSNSGAAYLYEKPGTGWASTSETQKINPTELNAGDIFGSSVAIDGTNAAISAIYDDDAESTAGAAYLYKLDGSTWLKNTKYLPATGTNNAWFGTGLSIDGDHILIGEPNNDDNNLSSGKVYYYSPVKIYITEQPTDLLNVCCFTDETFIVKGGNIDSYQWQISTDNGGSWSNLTDDAVYTGSTNDTLTVLTEAGLHNYQYRCYVSNSIYNTTSDAALLTIETTAPTITSTHSDQTINLDNNCEATLPDYKTDVVATDNCDTDLTITQDPAPGTAISGAINTVTLTATDDAGNSDEAAFNIEVVDNTDPIITSTHDTYEQPANESCMGVLPDFTGDVVASDNCDSDLDISQSPAPGTLNNGSTVTLYVTDDAGNTTQLSFATTVIDTTAPHITSTHSDQTMNANADCEASVPNYLTTFWVSDYCDGSLTKTQDPTPGTFVSGATNTITLTAEDDAGNSISTSFNLAVIDNTQPTITSSHTDMVLYPQTGCDTILPDFTTSVVAEDNCDPTLTITQSPVAGTAISGSINEVTLSAEDDDGNSNNVTFNVAVADSISPVITSTHENIEITTGPCEINLNDYTGDVTAEDNCDNDLTITQNPAPGTSISYEGNIITLTATDDAGNTDEVSFTIDIYDTEAPQITSTHNDIEVEAGENCETEIPDYRGSLVATDNCDNDLEYSQSPAPGTMISGTTNEVTLTATDDAGYSDEVTFNVSIVDNTGPVFTSTHEDQDIEAVENCEVTIPDYTVDAETYDFCSDNITVTQTPVAGTISTGEQITLTAIDEFNNSTEINFYVDVTDTTGPMLVCPENQVREADENGLYEVQSGEFIVVDTSDNCYGVESIINNLNNATWLEGYDLPVGNYTITWTAQDFGGYSNSCSFNVLINAYSGIIDFAESGIEIYPNPANESFILNSSKIELEKLIIKDLTGKTVLIEQISSQKQAYNITHFSDGVYIVEIHTRQGIFNTKLIVK